MSARWSIPRSRSAIAGLLAVPVVVAVPLVLMSQGLLDWALLVLGLGLIGLLVLAVLEYRHGHPRWGVLLAVSAVVITVGVGWYGWSLNQQLANIPRADDGGALAIGERPPVPKSAPEETKPVNLLLMGSDGRVDDPVTVAEMLNAGDWQAGAIRSDSLMVVHIPADRSRVYVISIPRDTYLEVLNARGESQGEDRVNAAFSLYGPYGTWRTVERLTNLRMDHMAIIDFAGFRDITTAIGGVEVYVPEQVVDPYQDVTWEPGWVHLEGDLALKYVRTRSGLEQGDFDRVARQQNFLRAVMAKMLANDVLGSPTRLNSMVGAVADNLTIDEDWSTGDIRSLILSLRGLTTDDVRFATLPLDHYETVEGLGMVNIINPKANRRLWRAVRNARLGDYLENHPELALDDTKKVR